MSHGFRINGHFIPINYDKNNDHKLQVSELSIWCKDNDFEYVDQEIVPRTSYDESENFFGAQFDEEKYSEESLRERYPENKYGISIHDNFIYIYERITGSSVLCLEKTANSETIIVHFDKDGNEVMCQSYDASGNLERYSYNGNQANNVLVDKIYEDITAKTSIGLPTTSKDIFKDVRKITPDNVRSFLLDYQQKAGETIFDAIFEERGLSSEERAMLVKHIKNMLIEHLNSRGVYTEDLNMQLDKVINYEQKKVGLMDAEKINMDIDQLLSRALPERIDAPNGKIDKDFSQGNTGDCWLVSAIKSISNNPKGLEILNNSISVNQWGDVTVTLKGVNKTYTIYKEEIEGASELSSGDGDVRALEIAVNRYLKETYDASWNPNSHYNIVGNYSDVAYDILLGTGKIKTNWGGYGTMYDRVFRDSNNSALIEKAKRGDAIINVSVHGRECKAAMSQDGSPIEIHENHVYSVVNADDEFVYLVNPWDTSNIIKMTHEDFKETFNSMRTVDLT